MAECRSPVLKGFNPSRFSVLPGRETAPSRAIWNRFPPDRSETPLGLWPSEPGFQHPWPIWMFWLVLVMPGGQDAWPWQTGTSVWWRRGFLDNNEGLVAERDVKEKIKGMSDTATARLSLIWSRYTNFWYWLSSYSGNLNNTVIWFQIYLQLAPTINHDINQRIPLTISASGPPKSRNIMRTPSSEDILRCSKGCCSRTLFLTPISSVNSVKPSSMWTPRVHSFPFQLQADRNENKKRC